MWPFLTHRYYLPTDGGLGLLEAKLGFQPQTVSGLYHWVQQATYDCSIYTTLIEHKRQL